MPSGTSIVSPHPTIANLWVRETDSLNSNLILSGYCNGTPDTTASTYSHGCVLIQLDSGTNNTSQWENVGTSASPSWHAFELPTGKVYGTVSVPVAGTAAQNVFGATNGFAATITSVFVIAAGATNATITIAGDAGATIATVNNGSGAFGVMTGAQSLTNTSITTTGTCTVASSSSSDTSPVIITFTVA